MKKGIKRLSGLILTLVLLFTSFSNVFAYDPSTITDGTVSYDNSKIVTRYLQSAETQYISLKGDLQGKNAKVYQQVVEISGGKTAFDNINSLYQAYKNSTGESIVTARDAYIDAVPIFNESNWSEVAYTNTADGEDRYNSSLNFDLIPDYFVVWVKATYEEDGKTVTVYRFDYECIDGIAKPVCSIVNDKYYDENGEETTKEKYIAACTCGIRNGKYYDDNGDQVDEATYKKACFACTVENGKYYNDKGEEVSEAAYKKACLPICTVEDGVYYDDNGNAVSKDVYNKKCSNPTTGNQVYYVYGISTIGIAFILYMFTRKVRKFSK